MRDDNMLVYEFDSITDKDGIDKINKEMHANPVSISILMVGRSAILSYTDASLDLITSKVESIFIHNNNIKITTKNTEYWLKPYIKEVLNDETD